MFTTDRLILRPFRDSDKDDLLSMSNIAEVERYAGPSPVVPHGPKFIDNILKFQEDAIFYAVITLNPTGEFMGHILLSQRESKNRAAMLGISMMPQYWSKGYGTEAIKFAVDYGFRWLGLHRVGLGTLSGNKRAIAAYKKA